MRILARSITVVLRVPVALATQGNSVKFPDVPELRERGCLVYGFQTYDVTETARTFSPNLPVISAADSTLVLLTLVEKSTDRFKLLPWSTFNQASNFGNWFETVPFELNTEACTASFTNNAAAGADFAIPVVVHYAYPKDRF